MFSSISTFSDQDDLNDFKALQNKSEVKLSNRIGEFLASPMTEKSVPIVYRSEHNIGFLKIEELHPFDSKKFEKIAKFLVKDKVVASSKCYLKARKVSDKVLRKLHTKEYLDKLKTSKGVAGIIEFPIAAAAPFWLVNSVIVRPMKYQVGGTILAGELAMKYGWSINLGGGMHHCSFDRGGGWCAFGDIQLSIINLREQDLIKKVMIIDLDAHQGNGHERDKLSGVLGKLEDVFILDMYRHRIYPVDLDARKGIDMDVGVIPRTTDIQYRERLQFALEESFGKFKPDIVYYNAGTDILKGDPLGGLNISPECVVERDRMVFEECVKRKIPIVMVTSGGYQKTNGRVIADSIRNLDSELKIMEIARKNYGRNNLRGGIMRNATALFEEEDEEIGEEVEIVEMKSSRMRKKEEEEEEDEIIEVKESKEEINVENPEPEKVEVEVVVEEEVEEVEEEKNEEVEEEEDDGLDDLIDESEVRKKKESESEEEEESEGLEDVIDESEGRKKKEEESDEDEESDDIFDEYEGRRKKKEEESDEDEDEDDIFDEGAAPRKKGEEEDEDD